MARTPIKDFLELEEGTGTQEVALNETNLKTEACGGTIYFQDFDLVATPTGLGTADKGKAWRVAGSPTGQWSTDGAGSKIAVWTGSGWVYMDPAGATPQGTFEGVVAQGAAHAWAGERVAYSPDEDEWHPRHDIWSTSEYWTGRYVNGNKRYRKILDFGTLPNNTVKNVAHSIASLSLADANRPSVTGVASDGTTAYHLPIVTTTGVIASMSINATNVNIITNTNLTTYSAHIAIEYCKTA